MTWQADDPHPGFWMVRCCRYCPFVAARIWLAHTTVDPVSGEPMDRSPFLAAQIGLGIVDVGWVWGMVEYAESSPDQQADLANPPLSDRAPRNGRAPAFKTAPMAKWRREQAWRITERVYEAEIEWLAWAKRNASTHPDYTHLRPVEWRMVPVPRFP